MSHLVVRVGRELTLSVAQESRLTVSHRRDQGACHVELRIERSCVLDVFIPCSLGQFTVRFDSASAASFLSL